MFHITYRENISTYREKDFYIKVNIWYDHIVWLVSDQRLNFKI